ncbi:MAG: CHAP domain-containing protein [Minicystis sp.]
MTDVDLLDRVTISGCSAGCTKIVDIPKGRAKDFELRGGAIPVLKNLQATTDKGCTVTWKGFEIDFSAAIAWLHQHANPSYTGQCASYVRQGLNAGGLSIPGLSTYGMDAGTWGPVLERNGFEQVATGTVTGDNSFSNPQTGDIVVFPAVPHHPNGHTAMWDGDHWVSDTVQNHFSSNQAHYRGHRYIIYRNRGSASGPGYQAHAQPE